MAHDLCSLADGEQEPRNTRKVRAFVVFKVEPRGRVRVSSVFHPWLPTDRIAFASCR